MSCEGMEDTLELCEVFVILGPNETISGFFPRSRLGYNADLNDEDFGNLSNDMEYHELLAQAQTVKHKQDMHKHHEVKVMSLPFETIKKQVAPFKKMVNFEADYGTDPQDAPNQQSLAKLSGDA